MKKFLLSALTVVLLIACQQEEDISMELIGYSPLTLQFEVVNSEGEDLLLPTTENYLLEKAPVLIYEGVEYPFEWENKKSSNSKRSFSLEKANMFYRTRIEIGSWSESCSDEKFTIVWGNGDCDEVVFSYYDFHKDDSPVKKYSSSRVTSITVNGKTPERVKLQNGLEGYTKGLYLIEKD